MDNFRIDVVATGDDLLRRAVELVFQANRLVGATTLGEKRGISHYAIRRPTMGESGPSEVGWVSGRRPRPTRLVLMSRYTRDYAASDAVELPFRLDLEGTADFARRWLEVAEYPAVPDIDGDCKKGWRIYNEDWGHVESDSSALLAVAPAWATFGK